MGHSQLKITTFSPPHYKTYLRRKAPTRRYMHIRHIRRNMHIELKNQDFYNINNLKTSKHDPLHSGALVYHQQKVYEEEKSFTFMHKAYRYIDYFIAGFCSFCSPIQQTANCGRQV